ncbi:MAG TPA: hypothetical protein VGN16_07785 [Acidobacteriaceae bacterium]
MSNPDQMGLGLTDPRRIPLEFTLSDVRKLKSESDAIALSVRCSGFEPKEIPLLFGIDAGQWSNILNGKKHFPHERRNEFMDFVGNEILLMYACESRGRDYSTLRPHRSEVEIQLEAEKRRNAELEHRLAIQEDFVRKMVAGK